MSTRSDDSFEFMDTGDSSGGTTSTLEIWEWRKMVEEGKVEDEPGLAGVTIYLDANNDGTSSGISDIEFFFGDPGDVPI